MSLTLDWDHEQGEIHLSMHEYIDTEFVQFQHPPKNAQHSLYLHILPDSMALNKQIKRKIKELKQLTKPKRHSSNK